MKVKHMIIEVSASNLKASGLTPGMFGLMSGRDTYAFAVEIPKEPWAREDYYTICGTNFLLNNWQCRLLKLAVPPPKH